MLNTKLRRLCNDNRYRKRLPALVTAVFHTAARVPSRQENCMGKIISFNTNLCILKY